MRFKTGINVSAQGDVGRELEEIRKVGYDCVYFDGDICLVDEKRFEEIRKEVEKAGIRVYSIHSPYFLPPFDKEVSWMVAIHREVIRRAVALGASCITHHPGEVLGLPGEELLHLDTYIEKYGGRGEFEKRNYEIMEIILKETEGYPITPTLENVPPPFGGNFATTPEKLKKVVDRFQGKFGICMDTGHAKGYGFDPANMLLEFGERVKETHFQDDRGKISERYEYNDLHLPVGLGIIDWFEIIQALVKIGYRNPVVFEIGGRFLEGIKRREIIELNLKNWRMMEELTEKLPTKNEAIL